jgi:uncharacterized repeat protein (TIGR01451 family)
MAESRYYHTLTLLPDGKALAAGSRKLEGPQGFSSATAELYDPATGTWSPTGSMPTGHAFHTATLLKNGKVLVVGGMLKAAHPNLWSDSAELYDPVAGTWSSTGSLLTARFWHAATPLPDGRVLVCGGHTPVGIALSAEIYDPATGRWTQTDSMHTDRYLHKAVVLQDGRVLVAGNALGKPSAEIFDPVSEKWSLTGPLPWPLAAEFTLTLLNDGRVLAAGGGGSNQRAALYDPASGVWTLTPPVPDIFGRNGDSATLLLDGTVFLAGPPIPLIFNPASQTWTSLAGSIALLNQAVRLFDGRVLMAGGGGSGTTSALLFGTPGTLVPVLTIEVTAPATLPVVNGTYGDNPFTITARVGNSGAAAATNVKVSAFLPSGLTLVAGSFTQSIGNLPVGQQRNVTWTVRASGQTLDTTRTYFVTAAASNAAGKSVTKQIMLPGGALTVASVTSKVGGDTGSVTMHVNGGGFLNGATVKLVRAGQPDIVGTAINVSDDGSGLAVTFDLTGQARGAWDVVVTNPDGAMVTLDGTFTIEQGRAAEVWVDVVGPPAVRASRPTTFYIQYGNRGNVNTSRAALLVLSSRSVSLSFPLGLNSAASLVELGDGRIVRWLDVSGIPPNSTNVIPVRMTTSGPFEILAWGVMQFLPFPSPPCVFPPPRPQPQPEPPRPPEPDPPPQPHPLPPPSAVPAPEQPWVACPPNGHGDNGDWNPPVVRSFDPNDKIGPDRHGPEGYVSASGPFSYAVFFENLETATAASQEVVVSDQLDTGTLDLTTFNLGPIAFGDTLVVPPPGLGQYTTDVDLRPANNLIVRINASLDMATGLVTWRFTSLNPMTMLPTEDPLAGFLPPNVTSPEGQGSVLFTMMPKQDLPTGTEIRNEATIVFDQNAPINTPEWFNTLDNTKPESQVLSLAATQSSPIFTVQWAGSDVGSGILNYSIFVSENGSSFTAWLTNTATTSANFTGQEGKTYAFYSIAHDQTGNREDDKTTPEAITQVVSNRPPVAKCQNVTVPTGPETCSAASASVNNGSFDPDGDQIFLVQSPSGPYNLGTTAVTLTVTDSKGASAACSATVTVIDQTPPAITCPGNQTAECTGPNGAAVSFSPTVSDNCSVGAPSCTPPSGSTFPIGSTPISCSATDGSENSSSCSSAVTVEDTTPPVISTVSANPNVLWPPNHKMVPVTVTVSSSDICDVAPACKITSVSSNEPVNGTGNGDKEPDWQITGNLTVNLRAERAGSGNGRVYTVTVACTDASGNRSTKPVVVTVPHDQGK